MKRKILIVENSEGSIALYKLLLGKEFEILVAGDIVSAEFYLSAEKDELALIIVGVRTNEDVLYFIENINDIPVLVMCSEPATCSTCNIESCMLIPIRNGEFVNKVHQLKRV